MRRVTIISGMTKMVKYDKILTEHYTKIGYEVKRYQFNKAVICCCHLHPIVDNEIASIIKTSDVIHCQSGGSFPILPYFAKHNIQKPLILESPALKATTGTFYAGLSLVKSYKGVQDNIFVQKILDIFCFTPKWSTKMIQILENYEENNRSLTLFSREDAVSDISGLEHVFHKIFDKGQHARLFYDNDFNIITDYISNYDSLTTSCKTNQNSSDEKI